MIRLSLAPVPWSAEELPHEFSERGLSRCRRRLLDFEIPVGDVRADLARPASTPSPSRVTIRPL